MKTKELSKKLTLSKTSIANLKNLEDVKGGDTIICQTHHQLIDCPYWTDEDNCPWP